MAGTYGIGEYVGIDVNGADEGVLRMALSTDAPGQCCPFRSNPGSERMCSKPGGVCSLHKYDMDEDGSLRLGASLITTCPHRFLEDGAILSWVGEVLLGTSQPLVVRELPFLIRQDDDDGDHKVAGKIDRVLVNVSGGRLQQWCALEMQAVYFSGHKMGGELEKLRANLGERPVFPAGRRHPDFRSSGPKRLMPQLQTKVPTIARWGKKTAVVIDRAFWDSLGRIGLERDLSNCEIVWFVVDYESTAGGRFRLVRGSTFYSTLSSAVSGLTGGRPVSLDEFEALIRSRIGHA